MTNYPKIRSHIDKIAKAAGRNPSDITVVAVTKNQSIEAIKQTYDEGCRDFGENRLQEALTKIEHLPNDIQWHFIGTLQSNKASKVISHFPLIHSIDSIMIAEKISSLAVKNQKTQKILLEVNTSGEHSKHGFTIEECLLNAERLLTLPNIQIEGLMTMAPLTDSESDIRTCFKSLRLLKENLMKRVIVPKSFRHLSMGMSSDYTIAIEEGATLLRIGSAIFK